MDIEIRDKKENYVLQVGDLIRTEYNSFYVITVRLDENGMKAYLPRCMYSEAGVCGFHKTLEELTKTVNQEQYTIYPKGKYKLELVEK